MRTPFDALSRKRSQTENEEKDRLCASCQSLNLRWILQSANVGASPRTIPFGDIKSSRKVCGLCALICESIEAVCASKRTNHVHKKVNNVRISKNAAHQLSITANITYRLPLDLKGRIGHEYMQETFNEKFYFLELSPQLLVDINQDFQLSDERPINFTEVKSWLYTCHHEHGVGCDPATKFGFVTRPGMLIVLDVQDLRIVSLPGNANYAALSYVWGGVQLLNLNKHNIDILRQMQGLKQFADLIPATIWDAINITKNIGLRYLWIDSICIQQDEPLETAYQIANMHNIFGSAYVTLIAASGTAANDGIPGTTTTPRQLSYGLRIADLYSKPIVHHIGAGLDLALVTLDKAPYSWNINRQDALPQCTGMADTKWNSRAWTFQEWQLSSRALVFVDGQVFWHCNKSIWAEKLLGRKLDSLGFAIDSRYSRLGNLTSDIHFRGSWKKYDASIEVKKDGRTLVVSSEALLLYKSVVAAYSPRQIGQVDDTLAAFDGIGKVLEQCFESDLLFGLPESLLDIAILWQPKTKLKALQREGFPSWSWASWQGAVCYPAQFGIERQQPRSLHENESAEERVQPLVRWYKADTTGGFVPINKTGIGIREAIRSDDNLPTSWRGVLAPNEDRNIDIDALARSAQLLRCYTMTAKCRVQKMTYTRQETIFNDGENSPSSKPIQNFFAIVAKDSTNALHLKDIGELVLDDPEALVMFQGGSTSVLEFIALSETQFFRSEKMNEESRRNLYKTPFEFKLYNIMAVSWNEDKTTAFRRGLGRIYQDEWERADPVMKWVNLG